MAEHNLKLKRTEIWRIIQIWKWRKSPIWSSIKMWQKFKQSNHYLILFKFVYSKNSRDCVTPLGWELLHSLPCIMFGKKNVTNQKKKIYWYQTLKKILVKVGASREQLCHCLLDKKSSTMLKKSDFKNAMKKLYNFSVINKTHTIRNMTFFMQKICHIKSKKNMTINLEKCQKSKPG